MNLIEKVAKSFLRDFRFESSVFITLSLPLMMESTLEEVMVRTLVADTGWWILGAIQEN